MKGEPPIDDLRPIWKNQTIDSPSISAQDLRAKAHKLRRKARRDSAIEFAMAIAITAIFAWWLFFSPMSRDLFGRVGWGLAAAVGLCMIVLQFRTLSAAWTTDLAPDAATRTSLDFYRTALEARKSRIRYTAYLALPLIASVGVLVVGSVIREGQNPYFIPSIRAVLPFCLLMILWGVWFIYGRRRAYRRLQNEIEALNNFDSSVEEGDNSGTGPGEER